MTGCGASSTRSDPGHSGEHVTLTRKNKDMTLAVLHKHYVADAHAHYGGGILSGGFAMERFSDVATEMCVRHDGVEGMFASYRSVQFKAPLYAGDIIEVEGILGRVGSRSRDIDFELRVVARRESRDSDRASLLEPPLVAVTASGTVVVPPKVTA